MTPSRLKQLTRKLERTNMLHPPEIRELVEAVKKQERELRSLTPALAFYADEARWRPNSYGITSAHEDRGQRARIAQAAKDAGVDGLADSQGNPSSPPSSNPNPQ